MAPLSGLKLVFSFILLSLFFFLFGLPSWTKFEAKQTIVLETTNDQDGNADPAITVCANNGLSGWRKNTSSIDGGKVLHVCRLHKGQAEPEDWVQTRVGQME